MEGGEGEAGGEPALRDEEKKSWLSSDSGFFSNAKKYSFLSFLFFSFPFLFFVQQNAERNDNYSSRESSS
jgi:hypothetical protein